MPRQSRIDTPGALHYVICRGIEQRKIFEDDIDRDNLVNLLAPLKGVLKRVPFIGVRKIWHESQELLHAETDVSIPFLTKIITGYVQHAG
jgi:hypothetical protein